MRDLKRGPAGTVVGFVVAISVDRFHRLLLVSIAPEPIDRG